MCNKPKPKLTAVRRSSRQHVPSRQFIDSQDFEDQFINAIKKEQEISIVFITTKEQADIQLSAKLRQEGVITTPGLLFEQSQTKEIEGLIAKGVFEFV
jgi:hypothetical protein